MRLLFALFYSAFFGLITDFGIDCHIWLIAVREELL
jgi:hypothetical protein